MIRIIFCLVVLRLRSSSCFSECPNNERNIGFNFPENIQSCSELTGYLYSKYDNLFTIKNIFCNSTDYKFSSICCLTCLAYSNAPECVDLIRGCDSSKCLTNRHECRRTCELCKVTPPPCVPCGKYGVCTQVNYYGININQCKCSNNYIGYSCSRVDICTTSKNPCLNGATCIGSYEEDIIYTCNCENGWSGRNCEIKLETQINDLKCLNGGTLSNENVCLCSFGYSGVDCGNPSLLITIILVPILSFILIMITIISIITGKLKICCNPAESSKNNKKTLIYEQQNDPLRIHQYENQFRENNDIYSHIHRKQSEYTDQEDNLYA